MGNSKTIKRLSKKQLKFTELFALGMTGEKAYEEAFGDYENSGEKALMLLSSPLVREKLEAMEKDALLKERTLALKTRMQIIEELKSVAFADINDFYPFMEGNEEEGESLSLEDIPREKRGAIASVTKGKGGLTIKLNDKFKAIELLEKELAALEGKEEGGDDELKVSIKVC